MFKHTSSCESCATIDPRMFYTEVAEGDSKNCIVEAHWFEETDRSVEVVSSEEEFFPTFSCVMAHSFLYDGEKRFLYCIDCYLEKHKNFLTEDMFKNPHP